MTVVFFLLSYRNGLPHNSVYVWFSPNNWGLYSSRFSPALVHRNALHQNDCRVLQRRVVWNGSVWQWICGVKRKASGTCVWVDAGCIRTPLWCACGWRCWINTFPKLVCCFHERETLPHLMFGGTDDRIISCRERRRSAPWGNNTTHETLSITFGHFKTQPFWCLSFIEFYEFYWLSLISGPSGRVENLSGDKFRWGFTTSVVLNFWECYISQHKEVRHTFVT